MYDVILFPTDGGEGTTAALEHAVDLAERHGATLDVLYVADDPTSGVDDPEAVVERIAGTVRDRGVDANAVVLEGPPHEKICEYVDERGVDVVVMGSHGRRGLDRYLRGSVTETVLRTVDVPVFVVPLGEQAD